MSAVVITDQRWAPLFSTWLADRFSGEVELDPTSTRFIAYVLGDQIVTVAAFSKWQRGSVELTVATDGTAPRKASRAFVFTLFDYAFNYAGKTCITAHSRVSNVKSHKVQEAVGFKRLALLKDYYGEDDNAYLYGLTKREWLAGRWAHVPVNRHGQQEPE